MKNYFMPHAPVFLPNIGISEAPQVKMTFEAMHEVGKRVAEMAPETIVVISPHGPRFTDAIAIYDQNDYRGDLKAFGDFDHTFSFEKDIKYIDALMQCNRTANKRFYTLKENQFKQFELDTALDHGVLVPLYFITRHYHNFKLVCLSDADFSPAELIESGALLRKAAEQVNRKVLFIASGDLSHTLNDQGPYQYKPAGKVVDNAVCEAFEKSDIERLAILAPETIAEAAICGLGPLWLLLGVYECQAYQTNRLSYQGPFGVGYAVAEFEKIDGVGARRAVLFKAKMKTRTDAVRKRMSPIATYALRVLKARLQDSLPPRIEIRANAYIINHEKFKIDEAVSKQLLTKTADVFVSIKSDGALRGCIGSVGSDTKAPLYEKIAYYVAQAASHDSRFEPIGMSEYELLTISVDVLSPLEAITSTALLDSRKYGIFVTDGLNSGVLLPAIEGVDSVVEQMRIAAHKGGFLVEDIKETYRFTVDRYL
ncbi:AmmeMemoRadiSam system protein B [Fusibacter paucivorans]|uniref:AmmeMemoRadiSam system protein B n=1 Tax=Fusibacter paucivorans TaxID=76009 RepID=A0ABS5PSQ0_9FIRM|nr:AmmeMemoRadiSam system protein B [Fusibacter paucivorans]MBS7528178.1 AmmeMemoRadiSam system protein B [Fusibacter paucivorans]